MTPGLNRRDALLTNHSVLGIDYLFVHDDTQTVIDVHFIVPPTPAQQGQLTPDKLSIVATAGGAPAVAIIGVAFPTVDGAVVMQITTAAPGTFTRYTFTIANPPAGAPVVDPYLGSVVFSFKAGCHSNLDCDEAQPPCPPMDQVDFPVDYQARDFWSLRTALLDFASQRYPRWADRLEADAAVMLVEVMSALGDEFAYYQDRVAREAYLETASQRRSLRRHARLVDYNIHDGMGASTWIDVTAKAKGNLAAGTSINAVRDGTPVYHSIGRNLAEILAGKLYDVDVARNEAALDPYQWDVHDVCLPVGTTGLYLKGDVTPALLPFNDIPDDPKRAAGRWMLLRTDPVDPALPRRRHLVRVVDATVVHDPLANVDTTHIVWEPVQALPFQIDLTLLRVHGNLVPAVAGLRVDQSFVVGPGGEALPAADENPPWAVERTGANGSIGFLFSLPRSDSDGLVRRADPAVPADPRSATPEVHLVEQVPDGAGGFKASEPWRWRTSFLGITSSLPLDRDFILDDGFYRRVAGYRTQFGEFVHVDYAANDGVTIRFGDNQFGRSPSRGTRFMASYLVGNGRKGNVPAGALTGFDQLTSAQNVAVKAIVAAVENPLAVDNGIDPEDPEAVRQLAPEAFRGLLYRAVRPEDYAEAVERLDWVQRAGASFRWTGSWQSAFVAADPLGGVAAGADQTVELEAQLDRFRQAGREVIVRDPLYADLDLQIDFCVAPDSYPAEVSVRVMTALTGSPAAFFSDDNFTFGTALDRARLEAVIQNVSGVLAVEDISFRRRGAFDWRPFAGFAYQVAANEVIRVENDPLHPDRGSIQLNPHGGA
jgi:hypothetical protein